MFRSDERRQGISAAIISLWRNWAVSTGFLVALIVLIPLVPHLWLAPVSLIMYLAMDRCRRYLQRGRIPVCSRLYSQVSVIILAMTVCLLILSLFERGGLYHELNGQPYTAESPVLSILLIAPLAALVALCFLLRRSEPVVCQRCILRYGNVIEHGLVGNLYRREWRSQTRMLFVVSLMLSVADWWYYFRHYVNTNLSHADLFFFIWMPLALYVCSLIYLGIRYYSLWIYYCRDDGGHIVKTPGTSTLRFLLICNDKMLIGPNPADTEAADGTTMKRCDTPVVVKTEYHETNNLAEAIRCFRAASGIADAEIRFAYESPDTVTYRNSFHYFAFVSDADVPANSKIRGEWLSWGNIVRMARDGNLSRDMVSEIKRIYSVAMAWKTYDRSGRRLYPIKHYKPTFRLRDLRDWEVDFNDHSWLRVALHNEDKLWFRLSRWFRRPTPQPGSTKH